MDLHNFGWDDWAMMNPEVFRPKARFGIALVLSLLSVLLAWQIVISGGERALIIAGAALLASNTALWLLFVRPKIVYFDEGLKIVNQLTEATLPWSVVDVIETQLAFSVMVGGKKFTAWAAPAPGRLHSRTLHSSEFKGLGLTGASSTRLSDSPRSDSGVAAYLARKRLEEFKNNAAASPIAPDFKFNFLGGSIMLLSLVLLALLVA